ncbi:hypothetical protein BDV3_006758 [Batrachochytrium dendrobatidis]|nr:hypothetical protein QVD99_007355 [Batrachochytrium dendrobatidis]
MHPTTLLVFAVVATASATVIPAIHRNDLQKRSPGYGRSRFRHHQFGHQQFGHQQFGHHQHFGHQQFGHHQFGHRQFGRRY